MRSCGLALPGTESRCYLPVRPMPLPIFSTRRGPKPDGNHQVLFLEPSRPPSRRVRAKAAVGEAPVTAGCEMNLYEFLGVPESGSLMEIKQAYKQMARKYHPDVSPPDRIEVYTRKFIQVQDAYETLSDPRTRALYYKDMARGLHLAFFARTRSHHHEKIGKKSGWKRRWEEQLSELKRRSMYNNHKDTTANMSWVARMRRQRDGKLQPRSQVELPSQAVSRRHFLCNGLSIVSFLALDTGFMPVLASAEERPNNDEEEDKGVFGAIKSVFDPNEKTKSGNVLPKAYLKSARELVKTLRESLQEDPNDGAKFRRTADAAKESIQDYLSNWLGQQIVVQEESYVVLEKAIRSLASFYAKAGPSASLPEGVKSDILNDLEKAEEFL